MIISRTPLRISFAGGGSDLSGYYRCRQGMVVSTAIDKYVYTCVNTNRIFEDVVRVCYSKTEITRSVDQVEHNIVREALKLLGIDTGIEIVYMGDIPIGSAGLGLGSSSSLAVGVLNALHAYKGEHVSAARLAEEACTIEIEVLGHPIGKQDQYIAAYGGLSHICFNSDESVFVDPVVCRSEFRKALQERLMLFFTGLDRVSSTVLAEQSRNTEANLASLDAIVSLAGDLKQAAVSENLTEIGNVLHEGWLLKRTLASGISSIVLDEYYNRARKAGATGGKICGAGGGGFLLVYCEPERRDTVRAALNDLKELAFDMEPQGSKIIYVAD